MIYLAEHYVAVDYIDQNRYTNDSPFHEDDEYYLLNLLETNWTITNTQNIKPVFYLTDKIISHDLSMSPAIKVYMANQDTTAIGLGFVAKRMRLLMNIEIISLDRSLMFDCKTEAERIVDFCRKNPIPGWDFVYTTNTKRMDPRPGNYHIVIQLTIERLVKPMPDVVRSSAPPV